MIDLYEVSFVAGNVAPYILIPAAIGAAFAAVTGRRAIAIGLLTIAFVAVIMPTLLYGVAILNSPSSVD